MRLQEWEPPVALRGKTLPAGTARCIAFDSGKRILIAGDDKCVHLVDWDEAADRNIATFVGLPGPAAELALADDGRTLAALADDRVSILIWDVKSGLVRRHIHYDQGKVTALAMSPDGKRVAMAGGDKAIISYTKRQTGPARVARGTARRNDDEALGGLGRPGPDESRGGVAPARGGG